MSTTERVWCADTLAMISADCDPDRHLHYFVTVDEEGSIVNSFEDRQRRISAAMDKRLAWARLKDKERHADAWDEGWEAAAEALVLRVLPENPYRTKDL